MDTSEPKIQAAMAIIPDPVAAADWTLYALSLACRLGSPEVAAEGLRALGIRSREALEATGADEYDLGPLRIELWRMGDHPKAPEGNGNAWMVAHHTGDGWYLGWTNEDGGELSEIYWPFGESALSGADLENLGFEVV